MQEITREDQCQTTVVCVDSYENGVLVGRMTNPCLNADVTFRSTMEFIKKMEFLLGEAQFPQSFSANRVFRSPHDTLPEETATHAPAGGKVATFSLRILFRQNASWQGAVTWVEGKLEESFRSVLELLLLIDSAIS